MLLSPRIFLFGITLLTCFVLNAQSEAWHQEYATGSRSSGLLTLRNGNVLHTTNLDHITEYSPSGTVVREENTDSQAWARQRYVTETAADTFLIVTRDGNVYELTDGFSNERLLGNLFPELTAAGNNIRTGVIYEKGDSLIVSGYDYEAEIAAIAHVSIADGTVNSVVRDFTFLVQNLAFSPAGRRAELLTEGWDYRIRVYGPDGALTKDSLLTGYPISYRKVLFGPDDNLYLLGARETTTYRSARLSKLTPEGNFLDTMFFSAPEYPPSIFFWDLRFVDDQLLLHGSAGDVNGPFWSRAFAINLNGLNDVLWRYESPNFEYADEAFYLAVSSDDPQSVYLAGSAGTTDIAGTHRAYVLKLDDLPVGVRSVVSERLSLYPNPVNAALTITGLPPSVRSVAVVDISGRQRISPVVDGGLNVADLPSGIYLIRAYTEGRQYMGKFIRR